MQCGVLFLLINSHSTQNTAVGRLMKADVLPRKLFRHASDFLAELFFANEFRKVNGRAMASEVARLVQGCE